MVVLKFYKQFNNLLFHIKLLTNSKYLAKKKFFSNIQDICFSFTEMASGDCIWSISLPSLHWTQSCLTHFWPY